ncbi:MAG: hypothetical protein ACRD01_16755 [Terriglobales bacterium]
MGTPGTGPTRIAQYEVIGLLGRGGIGEVVEARDTQLGRHVAPPPPTASTSPSAPSAICTASAIPSTLGCIQLKFGAAPRGGRHDVRLTTEY